MPSPIQKRPHNRSKNREKWLQQLLGTEDEHGKEYMWQLGVVNAFAEEEEGWFKI